MCLWCGERSRPVCRADSHPLVYYLHFKSLCLFDTEQYLLCEAQRNIQIDYSNVY